jgi:hypothetical protein
VSDRTGRGEGADSERLPWIEPFKEVPSGARPVPQKQASKAAKPAPSRAPWIAIGAMTLLAAGIGGGYWLGQRADDQSEQAFSENSQSAEAVTIPAPSLAEPKPEPEILSPTAETATATAAPVAEPPKSVAKAKPPVRKANRPAAKKIRHASAKRTQYERVIAKQREAAKTWPKMPSPGPAGQVIQLGAFTTRTRANIAYRERLARYPVLSGMPQVVVPVITQPRGEILYVLRLGTQSREQSNVVCGNLRRSGDHCLVIG